MPEVIPVIPAFSLPTFTLPAVYIVLKEEKIIQKIKVRYPVRKRYCVREFPRSKG